MRKIFLLYSLFIALTVSAKSNSISNIGTGIVTGKVIDKTSQQDLPYVTIVIKDASNKSITGGITDDKGNFTIKQVPEGATTVEIQFMGYKTVTKTINLTKSNGRIDLGTIDLAESTSQLKEVEVVAETSTVTQKIDRKVINVGKDLTSAGTTASELLNNVQSVSVDSQTGNVSLRGNENVRILVDGKPTNISSAQLLKQIPSTSIKSIELITNPSAKYNPEGMSGIINIILHKNAKSGFNGSVNSGLTYGKHARINSSVDMNLRTGKVNFYANYGLNAGKYENSGTINRIDNNSLQNIFFQNNDTSHLLKLGADYYINDKNIFSFYTIQNRSHNIFNGHTLVTYNNVLDTNSPAYTKGNSNNETYDFSYTLNLNDEGHKLELEGNFSNSNEPSKSFYKELIRPNDLTKNYNDTISDIRKSTLLNLDYSNPISKNSKLELGLEARLEDSEKSNATTQQEFVYDTNGSLISDGNGWFQTTSKGNSSFKYTRDIYSGYINYNQKFNKLSVQVGTRLENYKVNGTFVKVNENANYKDQLFSVYPSAFFTYNPNEKNQFQLSYSRRVDRPSIQQVNPIREWSSPTITSVGNPNLKPQFTNSYELNYTRQYNKGSVTFGTFYRRVNDNITRSLNIDPLDNNKVELTYTNSKSNNRYGLELSGNHKIAKWWRVNGSFDLYTQKESGLANGQQVEVTNNSLNLRANNNFTASKNLHFQLFAMYRGGGKSIQFKVSPMWMINSGASLNVLKGKGTISFRVNDIFKGMKFKFTSTNPYPQSGEFHWESRTAYLGFIYNFGGGKYKARTHKTRDNNETKSGGGFL